MGALRTKMIEQMNLHNFTPSTRRPRAGARARLLDRPRSHHARSVAVDPRHANKKALGIDGARLRCGFPPLCCFQKINSLEGLHDHRKQTGDTSADAR